MKLVNRRAKFEYELTGDGLEAGISLLGVEAKTLREGRGDLSQAFVKVINGEVYLVNANIPIPNPKVNNPTRARKLLLHKHEVTGLVTKAKQSNLQIVPIRLYNKRSRVKLYIELGKAKRRFEKKESLKKRDIERDIDREIKS